MKKLIIAVAALVVGFAANAGSIQWGGYVSNYAREDQTAQAGTVFNAIYIGDKDYLSALSTFVYDTYTGTVGTGLGADFVAADGQTILSTHTLTGTEAEAFAFGESAQRADIEGGVNGNWLITMYDSTSPDYFWVGQYSASGALDSTGAYNMQDESWAIGATMQAGVTDSSVGPIDTPEPTSGLLLLLGVAGLALRRRRA